MERINLNKNVFGQQRDSKYSLFTFKYVPIRRLTAAIHTNAQRMIESVRDDGDLDDEQFETLAGLGSPTPARSEATNEQMRKMWAGQSNILVAVRVRPLLRHDGAKPHRPIVKVLNSNVVVVLDPSKLEDANKDILRANRTREKRYAFDYVFNTECTQQHVFENTTKLRE